MFTVRDAALLRMTTRRLTDDGPWPDLDGDHVAQWQAWIVAVWTDTAFARAVETASPALARRVATIRAGIEQRPRVVRSTVRSVLRYRLRATGRATPFGLFAGVAPTTFGPATTVRIGDDHQATPRVDAVWLADLITTLQRCPDVAERVPLMLNTAAFQRDDRLIIGMRQDPCAGHGDPAEVSIRYTRAVEILCHAARTPIARHRLAEELRTAFPDTPAATISLLLDQLVEQRVLISALRPAMTVTDPLAHVRATVTAADAIPATAHLLTALRAADSHTGGPVRSQDLRIDADVVLPHTVATEAARAAGVMARLTPRPLGSPTWIDYHHRFLERYGVGAAIPLLDVVNPDAGLGFPAGYRGSLLPIPMTSTKDRDTALLRLAHTAALERTIEVVLDDATLTTLHGDNAAQALWPPHVELALRIHAASTDALDRGEFTLVVTGGFRAAGTTSGRFLDLLAPADRDRMTAAYTDLPTATDGALRVQVSCPPLYIDTENVARSPQVLPDLLSISEHRADTDRVLTPEDLLVVGDAHRFRLWSRSLHRVVEPVVLNAVEFTNAAHPLLRFVCELPTARTAVWGAFAWGIAADLPFLPRLTSRRTILSLARWTLTTGDLAPLGTSETHWTTSLTTWRTRMMTPTLVTLGGHDQRIRLDLDQPAHRHLLRAHLDRHGHATLHETPDGDALGWLGGHTHEIIVPLARTTTATRPPPQTHTTPIVHATDDEHLPGTGGWVYCKLYGHPARHTTLLTRHLPQLLSTLDIVQWWFLPYHDPDHHLRLRFRLADPADPAAFGTVAHHIATWATTLRRRRLITTYQLDTYRPETGRFGHGPAMTAAETVFAADSAATLAYRAHLAGPDAVDPRALTAAGLLDLAAAFTGTPAEGNHWLITHLTTEPLASPGRAVHDQALHLARPHDQHATVRALRGGEHITAAWARRRTALTAYRTTLAQTTAPDPDTVLASLLHLHCARAFGLDPTLERAAHRLARAAALNQSTHPRRLT